MMKAKITALLIVISLGNLYAQQLTNHTQYMFNDFALNPAVAGTKTFMPVNLSFRRQWVGIKEAPVTQFISTHGYVGYNMGMGVQLYNEATGPTRRTGVSVSGAYHLIIDKTEYNMGLGEDNQHTISFGMSFMLNQLALDKSKLISYTPNDPTVIEAYNNQLNPDANFGVYYHNLNKYYFGVSVMNLFQGKSDIYNVPNTIKNFYVRNYYLSGGATMHLKEKWLMAPSFLVQYIEAGVFQVDVGSRFIFDKKYWFGMSYRHQDAIIPMVGLNFTQMRFGYSYDITLSQIQNYSHGSHELNLIILIDKVGENFDNRKPGFLKLKIGTFKPEIQI